MANTTAGLTASWSDIWLLDGVRTPFADYNGALAAVSPTDLGIKAAREVFAHAGVAPQDVGAVITGSMAQASFDTYCLPRHIGLYSDVPIEIPAHMVQRVCGTGIEVLMQAADFIAHKDIELALCVGAESMSRNPVASYTMRGFRMGAVDFKDFLWEALLDPAANVSMGDTAENLARQYQITRPQVDAFAAQSFERALAAQRAGFFAGEITPIRNERFERQDYQPRELKLRGTKELATDTHVRPSPLETLAGIRPAFGGVQTGGNSSAIVDGAAAALLSTEAEGPAMVAAGEYTWPGSLDVMGWDVADDGLRAIFSRDIPKLVTNQLQDAASEFLARHGLAIDDIDRFICHPGGARVLTALEHAFGLGQGALVEARAVLRDYGNMSATTVMFVLERILAKARATGAGWERALMNALGPGFTAGFLVLDNR